MFKSIKLRIMKGRQLKPFATAKVLQEHEDRLTALEEGNSGEESNSSSETPLEESVETIKKTDISIKVEDENSNPVNQARVYLWAETPSEGDEPIATGTTGSAGGCTLREIEEGHYVLTASAVINEVDYKNALPIPITVNVTDTNEFTVVLDEAV